MQRHTIYLVMIVVKAFNKRIVSPQSQLGNDYGMKMLSAVTFKLKTV